MINQQLIDYIKEQAGRGTSNEQIRQSLLASGWQNADIDEAFNAVNYSISKKQVLCFSNQAPVATWKIIASLFGIVVISGGIYFAGETLLRSEETPQKQEIQTTRASNQNLVAEFPLVDDLGLSKREIIMAKHQNIIPREWGENLTGIKTKVASKDKVMALTFDACGGAFGSGYDQALIDYLQDNQIPATLFLSGLWIDANQKTAKILAQNHLFQIENHGLNHKPCSVNGKSAYNIRGTKNIGEVFDEMEKNTQKIIELTGRRPRFYRSGTAYYDEVCVEIAQELGYEIAGFSVIGDGGARFSKFQVEKALLGAEPGAIVLFHMNRPEGKTFEGIREALPVLIEQGYRFVKLDEFALR